MQTSRLSCKGMSDLIKNINHEDTNNSSMSRFGLHSGYKNATLRLWQSCGTEVAPHNLMLPLFITDESPDAK